MTALAVPLFDLGNVIVKVDFEPFLSWLTERSADRDPARARAVLKSSLFSDLEFGNLTREEFAARLRKHYRAEFTLPELEERFCAIFPGPVEGMGELLTELAAEGPVYCLSNTNEIHLSWLRERHPELLNPFARLFASHEIRRRKPYPGIYRDVAYELGVAPGELVFFDDVEANVKGARRAGLEAHLFSEAGQVRDILKGIQEPDDRRGHRG